MRVLVTGGTGYLGQAIVRHLVERHHSPILFTRSSAGSGAIPPHLAPAVVTGDVRDRQALVDAARGCDALMHTAALVTVWRPRPKEFDEVNVGGLQHALDAVRTHGLRRLVYTSSFLALPPAGLASPLNANDYQRTKAAARRLADSAHQEGIPIVSLYPGVVYGPGLLSEGNLIGRMIEDHRRGRLPGLLGADRLWSFAWLDEVARAHVAALEHPAPQPGYQLGGPNVPQIRPFEILQDLEGLAPPRRLPMWLGTPVAWVEETRARLTGRPPQLTRLTLSIFRHDWPLDSTGAERDLGYRQVDLAEGIRKMVG